MTARIRNQVAMRADNTYNAANEIGTSPPCFKMGCFISFHDCIDTFGFHLLANVFDG